MRFLLSIISVLLLFAGCDQDNRQTPLVITSDIDHFWEAYDQIVQTSDSAKQYALLDELFIQKGSPGLKTMMEVKRYTPASYIEAIRDFPKFWASIRANTQQAQTLGREIEGGVAKLKVVYPEMRPAKVYFTIGAFQSNGTALDSLVLIGSELAMADEHTVTAEFTSNMGHLPAYFAGNPIQHIVFLNVHEYVHTQQKTQGGYDLLSQSLFEGVAEFVPVIAGGEASPTPAISYGKAHDQAVQKAFAREMFSPYYHNWIWNDFDNEFEMRDLGYYVGYAIAETYYEAATDKQQAIKDLIELDYANQAEIEAFVEATGYFSQPLAVLKAAFEDSRPEVVSIQPFSNGEQAVQAGVSSLEITFSEAMDGRSRGFDYGPLGENHVLGIQHVLGYSEDRKTIRLEVETEADKVYQVMLTEGFWNEAGIPLKPYIIEIKTAGE